MKSKASSVAYAKTMANLCEAPTALDNEFEDNDITEQPECAITQVQEEEEVEEEALLPPPASFQQPRGPSAVPFDQRHTALSQPHDASLEQQAPIRSSCMGRFCGGVFM